MGIGYQNERQFNGNDSRKDGYDKGIISIIKVVIYVHSSYKSGHF